MWATSISRKRHIAFTPTHLQSFVLNGVLVPKLHDIAVHLEQNVVAQLLPLAQSSIRREVLVLPQLFLSRTHALKYICQQRMRVENTSTKSKYNIYDSNTSFTTHAVGLHVPKASTTSQVGTNVPTNVVWFRYEVDSAAYTTFYSCFWNFTVSIQR